MGRQRTLKFGVIEQDKGRWESDDGVLQKSHWESCEGPPKGNYAQQHKNCWKTGNGSRKTLKAGGIEAAGKIARGCCKKSMLNSTKVTWKVMMGH